MHFSTRAIHSAQPSDPSTGALIAPIYQTSTYAQEAVGVHKGYDYARVANPTRTALEECLASLEGAEFGERVPREDHHGSSGRARAAGEHRESFGLGEGLAAEERQPFDLGR